MDRGDALKVAGCGVAVSRHRELVWNRDTCGAGGGNALGGQIVVGAEDGARRRGCLHEPAEARLHFVGIHEVRSAADETGVRLQSSFPERSLVARPAAPCRAHRITRSEVGNPPVPEGYEMAHDETCTLLIVCGYAIHQTGSGVIVYDDHRDSVVGYAANPISQR